MNCPFGSFVPLVQNYNSFYQIASPTKSLGVFRLEEVETIHPAIILFILVLAGDGTERKR